MCVESKFVILQCCEMGAIALCVTIELKFKRAMQLTLNVVKGIEGTLCSSDEAQGAPGNSP